MVLFETATALLALLATSAQVHADKITYRGADISSLLMLEEAGQTYNADGVTQPLEKIMAANGLNTARQRLWVTPSDGYYGLDYNLKLSARATDAGMNVYLDLHFSDTWADPGEQYTPSGWSTTDMDTLAWQLYNYTKAVSDSYAAAGITPSIISIGNEISHGLLWPLGELDGDLSTNTAAQWYAVARLLHSAAWGIKDSAFGADQPKIMIHTDNGYDQAQQMTWYANVLAQGPLALSDFDQIGVSYYPFYTPSATFANLQSTLAALAAAYPDKQIVVAETDYPATCTTPAYAFPADVAARVPVSVQGQADWIQDVGKIVTDTPNGVGVLYWEPAWIGNAGLGSACEDAILVNWTTNAIRPEPWAALGGLSGTVLC